MIRRLYQEFGMLIFILGQSWICQYQTDKLKRTIRQTKLMQAHLLSAAAEDNMRQTDRANPVRSSLRLIIHILNKEYFGHNIVSPHTLYAYIPPPIQPYTLLS